MVKKEVFEWIRTGRKSIELRRGKAKQGNNAVFQCGKNILRGVIVRKEEGNLKDVLREDNYKNIIPSANNLEEATLLVINLSHQYDSLHNEGYLSHIFSPYFSKSSLKESRTISPFEL